MTGTKKSRKDHRGRVLPPNVSQKSDLRYIWRKMIVGRQYIIIDKDLNELKKKIIQKEAELQNGVYSSTQKITLESWFAKWMEVYKGNLKDSTRVSYFESWNGYIKKSQLAEMQISQIKRMHIVELYKSMAEDKGLATSTIHNVHIILYGCLEDACEDGIILANPCENAFKKIKRKDPKQREALTIEQQEAFINFIAGNGTYQLYLPLFTFFLGTGCRVGEVAGITWKDIDFSNNTIIINHTMQYIKLDDKRRFHVETPKTKAGIRKIPIIPQVRKQLFKQRELCFTLGKTVVIDGYCDFVFPTSTGKPYTDEGINALIKRIVKAYNKSEEQKAQEEDRIPILLPVFSAHVLRHTFCTRFCENESNIKVIQAVMGHQNVQTTLGIYAHATDGKTWEAMQKLGHKIKI